MTNEQVLGSTDRPIAEKLEDVLLQKPEDVIPNKPKIFSFDDYNQLKPTAKKILTTFSFSRKTSDVKESRDMSGMMASIHCVSVVLQRPTQMKGRNSFLAPQFILLWNYLKF
jgi:hypothetical protein